MSGPTCCAYARGMDEELTRHELDRLEAQRKLQAIPREILETVWVREAQIEAVVDAVLTVGSGVDVRVQARARRTGEWCARIAAQLSVGDPADFRRAGVLRKIAPALLDQIPELAHLSGYVREYQAVATGASDGRLTSGHIISVADEFDARIDALDEGDVNPRAVLDGMLGTAQPPQRRIVEALAAALLRPAKRASQAG